VDAWPNCHECQLPAICATMDEGEFVLACWWHGLDAMIFEIEDAVYCDWLDQVPWLGLDEHGELTIEQGATE
jgi:hypothetical protein